MLRRLLSSRRGRVFAALSVLALVTTATAVAFVVFNGVGGSSSGTFTSTVTNQGAITVSDDGAGTPLDAGSVMDEPIKLTNNTSASHQTTATPTVTFQDAAHPTCASHLSVTGWKDSNGSAINPSGQTWTANEVKHWKVTISADATTPATCAGDSWTATYAGTTT